MDGERLIGRDDDQHVARALMRRPVRLLTLWGPPGVGKTALARALIEDLPAAGLVSLEATDGPEGFDAAVGPVLAQQTSGWVVLDNLEHLLHHEVDGPAVLQRVQRWLRDGPPDLSLLVTSRRRLRLPDEHAVELKPLAVDHAVALFRQRVRRHHPDADPPPDESHALRDLVRALDGLPLALELAAARWELMGTAELLRRVSASPGVLADPGQADPRHATLLRAIGWSWALLDAEDQRALQALAVFHDPFALDDAEALVGAGALDRLALLRDSGLVQVASPGRFRLLSSIRTFVRDQTPEPLRLALAEAHATWLVARCSDLDAGPSVGAVRGEVAAAARFLVERDDPRALHVLELLDIASPGQHLGLFDAVVARRDSAGARLVRSRARRATGRGAEALDDVAAGLAMAPDPRTHTMLELMVGAVTYERCDLAASLAGFERALALARASGNRRAEALAVCSLAVIDSDQGRLESSERRYEAALDGFRAVGDLRHEATTLLYLGLLRHEQGLLEPAEAAYRDAIDRMTRNGDRLLAFAEGTLGVLCHEAGRLEEGRALHQRACERVATRTAGRSRSLALARLAAVEAALGELGSAREHLREASAPSGLDEATRGFVSLGEGFVALAEGRDDEASRLAREATHRTGGRTDARIALRILRRGATSGGAPLVVGDDWFEPPGGARAGLGRHATLLRMFHALVDAREAGVSLDVRGLFDAGWPGQRITPASERNRVHVNLAKLRTMGLRELILREGDGYRLDAAVPIVRRR